MPWLAFLLTLLLPVVLSSASAQLLLVGDISLARGLAKPKALAKVAELLKAKAVLGNLESPLTDQPFAGGKYDLRASPAAAKLLKPFTHLATENNHALDGGAAGQRQSKSLLRQQGIQPVTAQVSYSRLANREVAWLSFYDDTKAKPPLAAIAEAARQADLVVIAVHWGAEYGGITSRQRQLARQLVAAGAGLIVGSGPHVLQGHERIDGALVLYSLGNFLLDQPYPRTWRGGIVRITNLTTLAACAQPTSYRQGQVLPVADARSLQNLGLPACTPCDLLELPLSWDVRSRSYGDITGDGRSECLLALWRPWQDWPIARWRRHPTAIVNNRDAQGDSSHLAVVRPLSAQTGKYHTVWVGSALFQPVVSARLGPTGELIALETSYNVGRDASPRYRSIWRWNGFGFRLVERKESSGELYH